MNEPPNPEVAVFAAALELPAEKRDVYLDQACAGDAALRRQVEALLRVHDDAGNFFDKLEPVARPTSAEGAMSGSSGTIRLPGIPAEKAGDRIGRYKLLQQIGEGGCGVVYMAEQEEPVRRRVALKLIKLGMDTKQVITRFEAERQALALMDHPNIAKVLDAGATDTGRPYFVMELVRGIKITEYCDENTVSTEDRLKLFVQVCQAIQHAHQKGVIHRDIKPSNILVTVNDGVPVPKVIDFGIAKATQGRLTDKTLFTAFEQFIGTPAYMSPEQAVMTSLDIDTRSDIYSLGVLLYELLTGKTPFDANELLGAGLDAMRRTIREVEPPKPSTRLSTMLDAERTVTARHRQTEPPKLMNLVRGDLDWIVMKCLEKDRTRRYETANGLAEDIQRHSNSEPVEACPPSVNYRIRKFVQRHRFQVAVAAVLTTSLLAGVTVSTIALVRALRAERIVTSQRDEVASERDRALRAEADATAQRIKAESESRLVQLQWAEAVINQGDALTTSGEYLAAYARFAEAGKLLKQLGSSLARLDLSLVRLYRFSPPPLWNVFVPGGAPNAWSVIPARKELLIAGGDSQFHALDLLTGESLRAFGDASGVHCLSAANSTNGPLVVAGGFNFVRIIDPATGATLREAIDDRAMDFCALSPDGLLAASIDQSGGIVFWETSTMKRLGSGRHGEEALGLAFSHDGTMVASVSKEETVALWNPHTGRQIRIFPESPGRDKNVKGCDCVSFSTDDKAIFCGEKPGVLACLSVDGKPISVRSANEGTVTTVVATPEGQRIITSATDGTIKVVEPDISGDLPTLTLVNPSAVALSMSYVDGTGPVTLKGGHGVPPADQGVVVAMDKNGKAMAWPLIAPHRETGEFSDSMAISSDGLLVTGKVEPDAHTEVRDAATGRTLRAFLHVNNWSKANAFSKDGRTLYASINDGTIYAIDLAQNRIIWSVRAYEKIPWTIDVAPDDSMVATGGVGSSARVWDAHTGRLLDALGGQGKQVFAVSFVPPQHPAAVQSRGGLPALPSRRLIVSPGADTFITDWNLDTEHARRVYGFPHVRGLTFSPDGKLLAVSDKSGSISLLDAATLNTVGSLGPIQATVHAVQFIDPGDGPDHWAVSAGQDDLRVWDLTSGKEKLLLDTGAVRYSENAVVSSPDGSLIFASDCGRIDLTRPRRLRALALNPGPVDRAALYAQYGLWAWTEALLDRERNAGRAVPALLAARAHWVCGHLETARQDFDLAVARHEAPAWYADLCLSAGDHTPTLELPPSTAPVVEDPKTKRMIDAPLADGVLAASDTVRLRNLVGKNVVIDGFVVESFWGKKLDKPLTIQFAGTDGSNSILICTVLRDDRQVFDAAFNGDAAGAFSGARLRVHGVLGAYSGVNVKLAGTLEIILNNPNQVDILQ